MNLVSVWDIVIFAVCLVLSGFFSSSETAFTAASRIKIRSMVKEKVRGAKRFETIYKDPQKLLTSILIGNNLANVAASAIATAILLDIMNAFGIHNLALAMSIITAFVTFMLLIFGEITPKSIALSRPERVALFLSRPMTVVLVLFSPIYWVFHIITKIIYRALGIQANKSEKHLTIEEMRTMLNLSSESGELEKEKNEMINSIFDFSSTVVREIMTPRTDTILLDKESSVNDAIMLIMDKGHSRIPVFEEKVDNIIGVVYAKDLLSVVREQQDESVKPFMRDAVFIPESQSIESLLQNMQKAKFHMAIVVDEYGGMAGIVTMEDIIEEIVGEIRDEYDKEETSQLIEVKPNHFVADARININDFADKLEVAIPEEDDYDTLGGFVLFLFGKFPAKGESIRFESIDIQVTEIRKRRILKLTITKHEPEPVIEDQNE